MTSTRDPDRLIAAYLQSGPTELARDSYVAVDVAIRRTRQRADRRAWLGGGLTSPSRAAFAGVAIVVATLVGVSVFRGFEPNGTTVSLTSASLSVSGSPSASASSLAVATPTDDPLARVYRWPGNVQDGGYATSFGWDPRFVFQFFLENDWTGSDRGISRNNAISVSFFPIDAVVADPCARTLAPHPSSWSSGVVVAELGKVVTLERSGRHPVAGGRLPGLFAEFTLRPPTSCSASQFALFRTPEPRCPPDVCSAVSPPWMGMDLGGVATHDQLWLNDVDGQVIAMNLEWTDQATADDLAERDAILDSYRLLTPFDSSSPSPSGG